MIHAVIVSGFECIEFLLQVHACVILFYNRFVFFRMMLCLILAGCSNGKTPILSHQDMMKQILVCVYVEG